MPDQRSVMKEFRFLDAKRIAQGLTPVEEQRYAQLRDLVGPETGAGGLRSGFDVNAAAARLRDSLLPAGLRNRPPPPEQTPEPEPPPAEDPAADALASAYATEPFAPLEAEPQQDAFFDPATLGQDPGTVPQEPAWDPGQPADPGQGYDPNAPYDPNAQYAQNAPYDPGAPPYDPNAAGYDPNATGYDPNAAYDPNAPAFDPSSLAADPNAAAYDPNAPPFDPSAVPYDPNAQPFDAAQGYDPNAQPAWDPNAPYDPAAQAYDPGAPVDPAAQAYDAAGQPSDPDAQPAWDPNAPYDPAAQGYDPGAPVDPAIQAHDSAGQAWPEPPDSGAGAPEYGEPLSDAQGAPLDGEVLADPAAGAGPLDGDALALPPEGWNVEPALPEAVASPVLGEYDETGPGAPPLEDAGLESMLPFDPAAESAIAPGDVPEGYGRVMGEYDDTAGFGGTAFAEAPADVSADGSGFQATQEVAPEAAPGWQPDAALEDGFHLASGGSFDAAAEAAAPEWAGGTAPPPWEDAPQVLQAYSGDAGGDEAVLEVIELAPEEADGSQPEPTLDFAQPDLSAGIPSEDEAAFAAAPAGEAPSADLEAELAAPPEAPVDATVAEPAPTFEAPLEVGAEAPSDLAAPEAPPVEAAPPAVAEEGIPIVDGVDILEEIPPDEPAAAPAMALEPPPASPAATDDAASEVVDEPPAPAPAAPPEPEVTPAAASPSRVAGAHRVVVHTVEGQVKRGILEDADLGAASLALSTQQGGAPDVLIATERVKAIFFMLSPGEKAPTPEGNKVRVTFRDGRQVAGFSPDYDESGVGFFMIPGDTRTNTGRIWVYRSSVRQVTVS